MPEKVKRRIKFTKPTGGAAPVRDMAMVDGRTISGRRFKNVISALTADMGGPTEICETQKHLIGAIASIAVLKERLDKNIIEEQPVDIEQVCSLNNTLRRLLATAGFKRIPRDMGAISPLQSTLRQDGAL
jgi:hypothetical protein